MAETIRAHGCSVALSRVEGPEACEQTLGMFGLAEDLLRRAGMEFRDVVRTWIYMRDIDRDYSALNQARRTFFASRRIEPMPASTGIGGAPVSGAHDLCLGVYAVKSVRALVKTVMTSPTLNEASEYGADFVRGLRVQEANKVALLVSGDAERIRERLHKAGFGGFPHVMVAAPICRPDLLCETEALAVLPKPE